MDEITEYRELLRDWQYAVWFLAALLVATAFMLLTTIISPVYYQFNAMINQSIFIMLVWGLLLLAERRCQELRGVIDTLEHGVAA